MQLRFPLPSKPPWDFPQSPSTFTSTFIYYYKCNTFFIVGFGSPGPKIELLHGSLGSHLGAIEASITVKLKIKCINYLHMCWSANEAHKNGYQTMRSTNICNICENIQFICSCELRAEIHLKRFIDALNKSCIFSWSVIFQSIIYINHFFPFLSTILSS